MLEFSQRSRCQLWCRIRRWLKSRGNAGKGLAYSTQVCAQCHAVRPRDKFSPNPKAPSFGDIANTSGVTGISLAASLHSVHENMPAFVLSMNERDNIIAYILSLKGRN